MSIKRKEIRDWFSKALNAHTAELGKTYSNRLVLFDDKSNPEKFTNVYLESGEFRESEDGIHPLMYSVCEIGFHSKTADDDGLDHMEAIADRAIQQYEKLNNPEFSFYKTRYTYQGTDEDTYRSLFVTYEIVSR